MLETEEKFFEEHRQEWAAKHAGQFVLVKGTEVVGFFATFEDALVEGARRFGLQSFLVRSVSEPRREAHIPALALGVLHADPSLAVQG